jgi:hypothetical protein
VRNELSHTPFGQARTYGQVAGAIDGTASATDYVLLARSLPPGSGAGYVINHLGLGLRWDWSPAR